MPLNLDTARLYTTISDKSHISRIFPMYNERIQTASGLILSSIIHANSSTLVYSNLLLNQTTNIKNNGYRKSSTFILDENQLITSNAFLAISSPHS